MRLDLSHRPTLVKSWLATLHGQELRVQPVTVGPLPSWGTLLRTALAWHLAYALTSYAAALVLTRPTANGVLASALRGAGTAGTVAATLAIWWGAVGISTALWWSGVVRSRR